MKRGELIVTSTGQVQVQLKGVPIKLEVGFSDADGGEIIVPCDPHFHDHLDWEIDQTLLTIRWTVNGLREVEWRAWFFWNDPEISG
jgi:hypothetical protein